MSDQGELEQYRTAFAEELRRRHEVEKALDTVKRELEAERAAKLKLEANIRALLACVSGLFGGKW
jgi:uncharacterized protein YigA (DUF484 family)